jgi:hypothetical protein
MRLKRKPNPSRSIPSRSAPSFSPKMPMVPPRTSLRGTMGSKRPPDLTPSRFKPKMKKGGMVKSSASKRADGIAKKGKTKGRMV